MEPEDFKRWRKSLGLSQKDAAHALGLKRRVVQYYEKGERDGKDLEIPRYIRLACAALTAGVRDFHGPAADVGSKDAPKKNARTSRKPRRRVKKRRRPPGPSCRRSRRRRRPMRSRRAAEGGAPCSLGRAHSAAG
jgi:transcriptional regulator with XRE-family HTH domain